MYAKLITPGLNEVPTSTLQLVVQRYSGAAIGGYEQAEIEVRGPVELLPEVHRWLGYYVSIYNANHNLVWFGRVTQTVTRRKNRQFTKSLDDMANRIAVAYSYDDANGNATRGTTAWADDTDSQGKYGIKEQLQSEGDTSDEQAIALRDNALSALSQPVRIVALGNSGEPGGSLLCRGLWSTMGYRLFNQAGGLIEHDVTGTIEHLLGWGLTDTTIGFEATADRIHDLSARLKALRKDDVVVVSGAATSANNGQFVVDQTTTMDPENYTANTIRFEVADDIIDAASGLDFVQAREMIKVLGSAVSGNNRYYFTKDDVQADHITVSPDVTASAAGPSVTIQQGHSVSVTGVLTTEYPAASVTLTALGTIIAQSFTMPVNVPFLLAEVYVRVKRVGTPADSLRIAIRTDVAGNPNSSNLEAVDTVGATLGEDMNWVKATFSRANSLTYGTTYWVVVTRTGANDPNNYYMVDLSEDATYADGVFKLWNGSAWASRTPNVDMPFQVWSHRETTNQISDMLTAAGQFLVAQDIQVASGRFSRQYRNGDQTAQAELERLLAAGVNGGRRLLASVTADRVAHIYQEPIYNSDSAPLLNDDNVILEPSGAAPWEAGKLPHGQWLTLTDELPADAGVFIERAEFDAGAGKYTALETKGAPNPWDVVNLV